MKTILNIYPHQMVKQDDNVDTHLSLMFASIDIAQATANMLSSLFKGQRRMTGDGSETVQFDDQVIIDRELDEQEKYFIENTFPFVSLREAQNYEF